jgi:hypothetical protein
VKAKNKIPVTFNPLKHHLGYIIQETENLKAKSMKEIATYLLMIGDNLMDIYTGNLTVTKVQEEIMSVFENIHINKREDFIKWLGGVEYKKITLSDSSVWVVKLSVDVENFIHLHPGKKSPFTFRVRGSTLKTVVAFCITGEKLVKTDQLEKVNHIRTQWLNLSPVKMLQPGKGILKLSALCERHSV